MKNIARDRELMALGAYLASQPFREEIASTDFVDNEIAKCIEEMEGVTSGKVSKDEMRYLPHFMETLGVPDGVKAIDGLVFAVKSNRRMVEANNLGKRFQIALPHEIDQLKERAAKL